MAIPLEMALNEGGSGGRLFVFTHKLAILNSICAEDSSQFMFKTLFCHNGTLIFRFQTEKLSMWKNQRKTKIRWRIGFDSDKSEPLQFS